MRSQVDNGLEFLRLPASTGPCEVFAVEYDCDLDSPPHQGARRLNDMLRPLNSPQFSKQGGGTRGRRQANATFVLTWPELPPVVGRRHPNLTPTTCLGMDSSWGDAGPMWSGPGFAEASLHLAKDSFRGIICRGSPHTMPSKERAEVARTASARCEHGRA